jgi:hypothetical protein
MLPVSFLVEPRIDMDQRCESRNTVRTGFRNVALWGGVAWLAISQAFVTAAEPDAKPEVSAVPPAAAASASFAYIGIDGCVRCHESPREADNRPDSETGLAVTDFYLMNEATVWSKQDRHSQAFKVLENPRSVRMGELLGVDVKSPAAGCINCHALVLNSDKREIGKWAHRLADGVSCEACHGPGEKYESAHHRPEWRTLDPEVKAREFGFINVREAGAKTALCASCHVGDLAQGKFVTHEMYAAGHPPLPSVEPYSLGLAMPPHWRPITAKKPEVQKFLGHDPEIRTIAREIVLGGLVAYRHSVDLLDQAASREETWPDFAVFDCYACHHDLKRKSWRQERGYKSQPGRPAYRAWPDALPRATLLAMDRPLQEFDDRVTGLQTALTSRPFGVPTDVRVKAGEARLALDAELQRASQEIRWDAARSRKLLDALAQTALEQPWDFDSARQLGWAFVAVSRDLPESNRLPAEVAPAIEELTSLLALAPAAVASAGSEPPELPTSVMLAALAEYDPAKFQAVFRKLATALAVTPTKSPALKPAP